MKKAISFISIIFLLCAIFYHPKLVMAAELIPISDEIVLVSEIDPSEEGIAIFNLGRKVYDEYGLVSPNRSFYGKWIIQNDTENSWIIENPLVLYSYVTKEGMTQEERELVYKYALVYELIFENSGYSVPRQSVFDFAGSDPVYEPDGAIRGSSDIGESSHIIQPGDLYTITWTYHFDDGLIVDLGNLTQNIRYNLLLGLPLTEAIEVSGHKVWENAPTVKPDIEIQLMRNDEPYSTPELFESNETSHTWEMLPKKDIDGNDYVYTINEITNLEDYESFYSEDKLTVTNTFIGQPPLTYVITYTDGVDGRLLFEDQSYTVEDGALTPAFNGTPFYDGYTFKGWYPTVSEIVNQDVVYIAQWEANVISSVPSSGSAPVQSEAVNANTFKSPETGDRNNMLILSTFLLLSGTYIALFVFFHIKKEKSDM